MANIKIQKIIDKFSSLTEKPVKYLTVQEDIKGDVKNLVKSLYDFTKTQEQKDKSKKSLALPHIIIKDFDEEQIWQQIELQNSQCWDQLVWDVANSISNKNDLNFPIVFPEDSKEVNEPSEDELSENDDESEAEEEVEKQSESRDISRGNKRHTKSSIVDDQFFKLQDMEKFLINEEKMEGKSKKEDEDDESVDMFEEIDSEGSEDEGGKEMMYSDFFNEDNLNSNEMDYDDEETAYDKKVRFAEQDSDESNDESEGHEEVDVREKNGKRVRFAESDSESESDTNEKESKQLNGESNTDERKSEFELRQQRLKQQISKLEEKTLKEAPWQLKGEVDATKRPQNSLLEDVLDFDLTTRPPPIITEQTTVTLEGLIMQRIKDKAWDDVVRKEKPVDDQLLFKKPEVLDQSKSEKSLAQVYEAEYLKQKQALSGEVEEEKEPESHTEIRNAMSKLFAKLDALCHYHYTPKAPQAEVKIVSNTPAISMEEVAPIAASDATLLAPEEIKKKSKGDPMSKDERTQTDKNRERRKKKKLQRKKGEVTKVTQHKNTKQGVDANDKALKTSKAFFQQLNDETKSLIKTKAKKM